MIPNRKNSTARRAHRRVALATVLASLATTCWLAMAPAAAAQPSTPTLSLKPASGPPGALATATGDGFLASACGVRLAFDSEIGPTVGLGQPDEEGGFQTEITIPANAAAGEHPVFAIGLQFAEEFCGGPTGEVAQATFTVEDSKYLIRFKTGAFVPPAVRDCDAIAEQRQGAPEDRVHFLLQFYELPDAEARRELTALDIRLVAYVTGNTYIGSTTVGNLEAVCSLESARFAGPLNPGDKLGEYLRNDDIGPWAELPDGRIVLTIQFHADVSEQEARAVIEEYGGEVITYLGSVPAVTAAIDPQFVDEIAGEDSVQFLDVVSPPLGETNDGARPAANVTPLAGAPYNLTGTGVTVLVYDVGRIDDGHLDFGARIVENDGSAVADHATHVGGTVAGSGVNSNGNDSAGNPNGGAAGQWAGMAPAANLRSFGIAGTTDTLYDSGGDLNGDFTTAIGNGVDLASMSLGNNVVRNGFPCGQLGDYTNTAILIDNIVGGSIGGQQLVYFQAAGNERQNGAPCGQFSTVGSPATSKNGIAVGAVNSNDNSITGFTSFGPTDDGRLKPDISAPGCQSTGDGGLTSPSFIDANGNGVLNGAEVRNAYVVKCGTSMATPVASGATALLVEQWRTTRGAGTRPLPHTVKAILAHTSVDRGNAGPDYRFGFGTLDAQAAVDLVRADDTESLIHVDGVDQAQTDFYSFNSDGSSAVRVTLAWDDPAGTRLAAVTLVNDVDLRLIDPDGIVYQPLVLDPANPANAAAAGNDARNNVEMVTGAAKAGYWTVSVAGTAVPQGPQAYTLITPDDADLNRPPVCDAGGPYLAECTGSATAVDLDGTGSIDPDGDPLTYTWTGGFLESPAGGAQPTVTFPVVGGYDVDLEVSDGTAADTCSAHVDVVDTLPPTITVPADVSAECTSPIGTPVDIGVAVATDTCDAVLDITNDAPPLFPLGPTTVTWTAADDSGNAASDTQLVTVVDTTPPELSVSVSPDVLWPPNHKLVPIHATIVVSDICDAAPTVELVSIVSSEPDNSTGDGNTTGDIADATLGTDDRDFSLRSERKGNGTGRVYTITYRATDASGNTTVVATTVKTPKSQGKK